MEQTEGLKAGGRLVAGAVTVAKLRDASESDAAV
jgi:hypothetical protein